MDGFISFPLGSFLASLCLPSHCFPTCVTYILLEGNGVIGRGRPGVILNGWLDWSVIRLAGPLCPVTACVTYKATPSWVQSEARFFPFFLLCYQNRNPSQMSTLYFCSIHIGKGGIEHSAQGRKQKRTTGSSSGSLRICLSLLSHDISASRIHFTR